MTTYSPALRTLRQRMTERLLEGEVRTLCFDLGIDFESLSGDTKPDRVRELIAYCISRELVVSLLDSLTELRSDIDLSEIRASLISTDKTSHSTENVSNPNINEIPTSTLTNVIGTNSITIEPIRGSIVSIANSDLDFAFFSGYGMSRVKGFPLSNGLTISFEKIKMLDVLGHTDIEGDYGYTKDIRLRFTLTSGRVVEDNIVQSRPRLLGQTELGELNIGLEEVKRITFG